MDSSLKCLPEKILVQYQFQMLNFNDKLNTLTSGILNCPSVSINSFGRIPSTPSDLLSFIAFIFLATISGVTIICLSDYLDDWKNVGQHT